jgi:putative resolvase
VALDGYLVGNYYASLVIPGPQTVLPSMAAFQATARKKMATLIGRSRGYVTMPTTTGGRSKIRTLTLGAASTKTAVASSRFLDDVQDAEYGRVLVTYEDRLTRFGFSYLERYFDYYGVTITVIEDETDKSAQKELVDDFIKLVASFSGKLYGMRSSKKQQVVNTVESEVKPDE